MHDNSVSWALHQIASKAQYLSDIAREAAYDMKGTDADNSPVSAGILQAVLMDVQAIVEKIEEYRKPDDDE